MQDKAVEGSAKAPTSGVGEDGAVRSDSPPIQSVAFSAEPLLDFHDQRNGVVAQSSKQSAALEYPSLAQPFNGANGDCDDMQGGPPRDGGGGARQGSSRYKPTGESLGAQGPASRRTQNTGQSSVPQTSTSRRVPGRSPSTQQHPASPQNLASPAHEGAHHPMVASPYGYPSPPHTQPPPYNAGGSFVGQYPMASPPLMNVGHPPSPFPYAQGYPPGHGPPEGMMSPQNIHAGFQSMAQFPSPVHPYHRYSPEGAASYSATPTQSPSWLGHGPMDPSPPPRSPHPSQSPGSQHPPNYGGASGSFRPSMNFSPQMPTQPQFAYPQQHSFAGSPIYQSQYGASSYPHQQYTSPTGEQEGSGTWWYIPPGVSIPGRQFDASPQSFPGHFQPQYSPGEGEPSYNAGASSTTSPAFTPVSPSTTRGPPHGSMPAFDPQVFSPSGVPPSMASTTPNRQSRPLPPASGVKSGRQPVRRSYHPNPPAQRSEWVMWAGNVSSDASHDELWRFFNQLASSSPRSQPSDSGTSSATHDEPLSGGVVSIFLISRSNCAFVNFETEAHLNSAIARFNNKPLRPNDPRCPHLVCRVRRKDDDLKAGVGGQRGIGMHTRWVKDQRDQKQDPEPSPGAPEELATPPDPLSSIVNRMKLTDESPLMHHSSSSGSYASTNSSFLVRHFPTRYFILKSLTQFDLDLSVEKGVWATQKHNEGILDQAFRTSKDVYLIFGVNKSGEFYGYARMASTIHHGEHKVSWATRSAGSPASSRSAYTGRSSLQSEVIHEEQDGSDKPTVQVQGGDPSIYFPSVEQRMVEQSPMPVSPANQGILPPPQPVRRDSDEAVTPSASKPALQSAPAELGPPHHKFTMQTPRVKHSLDYDKLKPVAPMIMSSTASTTDIELDRTAPIRAIRANRSDSESEEPESATAAKPGTSSLPQVVEEEEKGEGEAEEDVPPSPAEGAEGREGAAPREEGWGESFKIEWIRTQRLPFYRTRHLRNPWNHDREVKVSRDGTELEPLVGQQLLEEWDRLSAGQQVAPAIVTTPADRASSAPIPTARRGGPFADSPLAGIAPKTQGSGGTLPPP